MSDVNFINSYNEIVFDNFIAILKQNLVFQTQLKLIEPKVARIPELEQQLAVSGDSSKEVERLTATIQTLTSELNGKTAQLQQQSSSDADRHRIQTALNEKMRECETLKASVEVLNRELQSVNTQASRGEDALQTNETLRSSVEQLTKDLQSANSQAARVQEVLQANDSLRTITKTLEDTVQRQNEYIKKLEEMLPSNKKRKIGLPIPETQINIVENLIPIESTGGIF